MSSDHSVNNAERFADYWVFGGIFRPVYLESFPEEHIERVAIDAKADGSFAMDVFTQNLKGSRTVSAEIIDSKNKVIATCNSIGKDSLVTLSCKVSNPELWTAETPNRYSVRVSLKNGKTELYSVTENFGFRTIEIRQGDGILPEWR